jgi:YWFCY protein/Type IV secretory system Conjugative DNA transfer
MEEATKFETRTKTKFTAKAENRSLLNYLKMDRSSQNSARSIATLSEVAGLTLLLLHLYTYCYILFDNWGMSSQLTDRILGAIARTGLFDGAVRCKALSLVFLLLAIVASPHQKVVGDHWTRNFCLLGLSIVLYFWSTSLSMPGLPYLLITGASVIAIIYYSSKIIRHLPLPWNRDDPFAFLQDGFPQENRKLATNASLHLRTKYVYKGKEHKGWANLVNPRRGILVIGTPGSGKSRFVIEPLMRQLMEQGRAIFVFDYKYDALTRLAFGLFQRNKSRFPLGTSFYCINFTDLSRSHRCNVLAPSSMLWLSDAIGASRTILLSLNKTWVERQGDFWVESAVNFIAALIWYLREYKEGIYCTLPHVIELSKQPYDKLFALLEEEPSVSSLIDPFVKAYSSESKEMLDGQLAGAKMPLARLSSPDLYYVLTGNDFSLDINDPKAPKIFCLGGDPSRAETLAPILSLYIDRLTRICNQPGRHPCALICDEFATLRAHTMLSTIATARAHDIIPILCIQDVSQLRTLYSRNEADEIVNISGNVLWGQTGGETARWASERFPKVQRERTSVSTNSADTSFSKHLDWEQVVTPATVATLSSGEFLGVVADDPQVRLKRKGFYAQLVREPADDVVGISVPVVREVDRACLEAAFTQVRMEIGWLIAEKISKLMEG